MAHILMGHAASDASLIKTRISQRSEAQLANISECMSQGADRDNIFGFHISSYTMLTREGFQTPNIYFISSRNCFGGSVNIGKHVAYSGTFACFVLSYFMCC